MNDFGKREPLSVGLSRSVARAVGKYDQFDLYVALTAFTFLSCSIAGYDILGARGLFNNFWFLTGPGADPGAFHPTLFSLPVLSGLSPAVAVNLQVASCALILFKPMRRWGGIGLFFSTVMAIRTYESVSVLTNYYLLFASTVGFIPARGQRGFLIGGISAAFMLSAVHKLNTFYLSGAEIQLHLADIGRFLTYENMRKDGYARAMALAGVLLEGGGALLFFCGTSLATAGFLSAIIFAAGVMLHITGGHAILRFLFGLSFLLEFPWANLELFLFLLIWPFLFEALTRAVGGLPLAGQVTTQVQAAMLCAYVLSYLVIHAILILKRGWFSRSVSGPGRNYRIGAACLCVAFAAAVRLFSWPTPLGWTQYSGYKSQDEAFVLYVWGGPVSRSFNLISWDQRQLFALGDRLVLGSLYRRTVDEALAFLCRRRDRNLQIREEKMIWRDFMALAFDRDQALRRYDSAMASARPLMCGETP